MSGVVDIVLVKRGINISIIKCHIAEKIRLTVSDYDLLEYFLSQIDTSKITKITFQSNGKFLLIDGTLFPKLEDLVIDTAYGVSKPFKQEINVYVDHSFTYQLQNLGPIQNLNIRLYAPIAKTILESLLDDLSWFSETLHLRYIRKKCIEQIKHFPCETYYYDGPNATKIN